MVWRTGMHFCMRFGKQVGLEPVRVQSGNSSSINAAVVVVRVPGGAELVEHQQQQDQPASEPMRRARRRGAQGSLGTRTGRTHVD